MQKHALEDTRACSKMSEIRAEEYCEVMSNTCGVQKVIHAGSTGHAMSLLVERRESASDNVIGRGAPISGLCERAANEELLVTDELTHENRYEGQKSKVKSEITSEITSEHTDSSAGDLKGKQQKRTADEVVTSIRRENIKSRKMEEENKERACIKVTNKRETTCSPVVQTRRKIIGVKKVVITKEEEKDTHMETEDEETGFAVELDVDSEMPLVIRMTRDKNKIGEQNKKETEAKEGRIEARKLVSGKKRGSGSETNKDSEKPISATEKEVLERVEASQLGETTLDGLENSSV